MTVVLAPSSFRSSDLQALQPLANQVAATVDLIIPGQPLDYPASGIVAFQAPHRWSEKAYSDAGFSPPPVTINGPKVYDEPLESFAGEVRIALAGVGGGDEGLFVFQLAHELAHVKMGMRTDNFLDETFAVAVSLEVLRRLGYAGHMLLEEGTYLQRLPLEAQRALAFRQWDLLRTYWQKIADSESKNISDTPSHMLGAMLIIRSGNSVPWATLFGASTANACSAETMRSTFEVCEPDIQKMRRQRQILRLLGYK